MRGHTVLEVQCVQLLQIPSLTFRMQNANYTAPFAFEESSSSEVHLRLPLSPSQTARRSHSKLSRIFLFTSGKSHSLYCHKKPP